MGGPTYACLCRRLNEEGLTIFLHFFDRARAVHAGAALVAHGREVELPIANLDLHPIVERTPRASTPTAIELVWGAFPLPTRLTRVEKVDQLTPMNQRRSVPVDGRKSGFKPLPNGVTMQPEQFGDLAMK